MADDEEQIEEENELEELELQKRRLEIERLKEEKRRSEREDKRRDDAEKKSSEGKRRKEKPNFTEKLTDWNKEFSGIIKTKGFFGTLFWLIGQFFGLLFSIPRYISELFSRFGFVGFIGFLILVGFLLYFFLGSAWAGSLARATVVPLYQGVIDPALEAVLPGFKENLVKGFRVVLDPESAREEFDPSAAKEVNTGSKGVIFESVSKNRDVYFVGDIVEVSVRAKVYGLNDVSTNVRFSCDDIDSVRPEVSISGVGGDSVVVPADIVKSFFITCRYEGLKFNNPTARTEIKKMKFKALYSDFVTLAELDAYILSSSSLDDLEARNIDVFADISDSNLNKRDRTVRPRFSEGPIKLDIDLPAPHPLTESAPYQFFVKVINQEFAWKGDVVRVSSLALRIPEGFSLGDNCEFDSDGKIKTVVLDRMNKEFVDIKRLNEEFGLLSIEQKEAASRKRDVKVACSLLVNSVQDQVKKDVIQSELVYDYEFTKLTTFEINKPVI